MTARRIVPCSFTHCQFSGGKLTVDPGSVDLNNCLWQRVYVTLRDLDSDPEWNLYNNLFYGGTLYYRAPGDNPTMLAYDNFFDRTTITRGSASKYFTHDYNGYISGQSRLQPSPPPPNDVVLANMVYATGPCGDFYQVQTELRDEGSRSATAAGLYHHTTREDQMKETSSTVDIGFHYVAVNVEGNPADTDADGLADYLEDTNGDGTYATGDFADWNDADTDNDGMPDGWEWQHFGTFSLDGNGDFDGDGSKDRDEYTAGTNPLSRGKVILVVDDTMAADPIVSPKIERLVEDLVGDGWRVLRHDVARGVDTPGPTSYPGHPQQWTAEQWAEVKNWSQNNCTQARAVRAMIKADYDAAPGEVKAVVLLGRVPVPYAGDSTDITGSHLEMMGAHPADTFYGEVSSPYGSGGWNDDTAVDNSHALTDLSRDTLIYEEGELVVWVKWPALPTQRNRAEDGQFNNTTLPSGMELGVGRIDLSGMPAFGVSHSVLISRYLDKDHAFRRREGGFQTQIEQRALVAPRVPPAGQFEIDSSALISIFGESEVHVYPNWSMHWFGGTLYNDGGNVTENNFLIGYGGGFGSATSAYGIGATYDYNLPPDGGIVQSQTNNFVDFDSRVVFVNLYGSVFGSWDQENNLLRAPLANPYDTENSKHGYGLTTFWGRQRGLDLVSLEKRALGATIGEALLKEYGGNVNYGLMGDPTMRMHYVQPPSSLLATKTESRISLTWVPSAAENEPGFQGYRVFRGPTQHGPFVLATAADQLLASTSYVSARPPANESPDNYYMVRAVKTEITRVGSYVNMSEGTFGIPGTATAYLELVSGPANRTVTLGQIAEPVAFSVDALGVGSQTLSYQWLKDDVPLQNGGRISGVTNRTLLIDSVELGDAGSFRVRVSNEKASLLSETATLTVSASP